VQVVQLSTQRHGSGWRVRSGSGGGFYCVHFGPRRNPCPAWAYERDKPCKHIKAVEALLAKSLEVAMA
jgi:hypothetical protein